MTASTAPGASRVLRAGGTLVRRVRAAIDPSSRAPAAHREPTSGWLAVTVLRDSADLESAALPAPLAELGDQVEVRIRPAPNGKGAELAARLRDGQPAGSMVRRLSGSDPQSDLRSALRRAKQLIEVGEVLGVDPAPHGKRSPTPGGALLEAWTRVAPKGGVR
jgi:hypothetical protein